MPPSPHSRSVTRRSAALSVCAVAVITLPFAARAQQIDLGPALSQALGKAMSDAFASLEAHRVAVSPAIVTIDPKTLTASVELQNRSTDPIEAELTVGTTPPTAGFGGRPAPDSAAKAGGGSPLLADDAPKGGADSAASGGKAVATSQSLAPWVTGLPSTVHLAPGEKKSITVTLKVPSSRAAGEYAAWLVATTKLGETSSNAKDANGKGGMQIKLNGGGRLQGGARLVYKAE